MGYTVLCQPLHKIWPNNHEIMRNLRLISECAYWHNRNCQNLAVPYYGITPLSLIAVMSFAPNKPSEEICDPRNNCDADKPR